MIDIAIAVDDIDTAFSFVWRGKQLNSNMSLLPGMCSATTGPPHEDQMMMNSKRESKKSINIIKLIVFDILSKYQKSH